jgi:hypothetical protein
MVGLAAYVVLWSVAQYLQGLGTDYMSITQPVHAVFICAAAGFTLVTRVQATPDHWTRQLWFIFSIGLLIDYGTETVLGPLVATLVGSRMDLIVVATYIHLAGGVVGYGLMSWGLMRVGTTILAEKMSPIGPALEPPGSRKL